MFYFQYPVEEMIRLLCFEDAKQVESFCYHYCLSLKGVDVELDSKAYTEPEGSLPQTRSQSLIEIKQESLSIGEVSYILFSLLHFYHVLRIASRHPDFIISTTCVGSFFTFYRVVWKAVYSGYSLQFSPAKVFLTCT